MKQILSAWRPLQRRASEWLTQLICSARVFIPVKSLMEWLASVGGSRNAGGRKRATVGGGGL